MSTSKKIKRVYVASALTSARMVECFGPPELKEANNLIENWLNGTTRTEEVIAAIAVVEAACWELSESTPNHANMTEAQKVADMAMYEACEATKFACETVETFSVELAANLSARAADHAQQAIAIKTCR